MIKTKTLILNGLKEINSIKNKVKNVDIRTEKYNCDDLALVFELQYSLISAE